MPGSSPRLLSQGTGGNYCLVKRRARKLGEPTLGLMGTGVTGLSDCLVTCCMGPKEPKLEKGGHRERSWWIPYTTDAMKRHAAHVTQTGHASPLSSPAENKHDPRAGFLGNSVLPVPFSASPVLKLLLLFVFTGCRRHGEEKPMRRDGSQPSRWFLAGLTETKGSTGS